VGGFRPFLQLGSVAGSVLSNGEITPGSIVDRRRWTDHPRDPGAVRRFGTGQL